MPNQLGKVPQGRTVSFIVLVSDTPRRSQCKIFFVRLQLPTYIKPPFRRHALAALEPRGEQPEPALTGVSLARYTAEARFISRRQEPRSPGA